MEVDDQFELEHLYLTDRKCRNCGEIKDLISEFYRIRKNKYNLSSYSYECKECTIKRVTENRKERRNKIDILYDPIYRIKEVYPDW